MDCPSPPPPLRGYLNPKHHQMQSLFPKLPFLKGFPPSYLSPNLHFHIIPIPSLCLQKHGTWIWSRVCLPHNIPQSKTVYFLKLQTDISLFHLQIGMDSPQIGPIFDDWIGCCSPNYIYKIFVLFDICMCRKIVENDSPTLPENTKFIYFV